MWSCSYFQKGVQFWPSSKDSSFQAIFRRSQLWAGLAMMCECASLGLVSDVANRLLQADIGQHRSKNDALPIEKKAYSPAWSTYAKIFTKSMFRVLIEAVPNSWFAITLLGLSRAFALATSSQLITTAISI